MDEQELKERIKAMKESLQDVEKSSKELKRVDDENDNLKEGISIKYFGKPDEGYRVVRALDNEIERCRLELCELRGE